jgi:hypothetical protein
VENYKRFSFVCSLFTCVSLERGYMTIVFVRQVQLAHGTATTQDFPQSNGMAVATVNYGPEDCVCLASKRTEGRER